MEFVMTTALERIDAAKRALIEAKDIHQTLQVRDQAAAISIYAEARGASEAAQLAKEVQIRAERKAGEFLQGMEKAKGGGDTSTGFRVKPVQEPDTLSDLGISKRDSHRWQTVARMPDEEFERHIAETKDAGEELTSGGTYRTARRLEHPPEVETPNLPEQKYRVIYADPPWKYSDTREELEGYGPARRHYSVMTIEQLCDLPIWELSEKDAVLFLWVPSPLLEESFSLVNGWGFKYKASFVWDKIGHNYGHYNSVRHEFLLLCTKGSCLPDSKELQDSVISIGKTRKHSEKPEEFRKLIDSLYPNGKRIELFRRGDKPNGWEIWGAEASEADFRTE